MTNFRPPPLPREQGTVVPVGVHYDAAKEPGPIAVTVYDLLRIVEEGEGVLTATQRTNLDQMMVDLARIDLSCRVRPSTVQYSICWATLHRAVILLADFAPAFCMVRYKRNRDTAQLTVEPDQSRLAIAIASGYVVYTRNVDELPVLEQDSIAHKYALVCEEGTEGTRSTLFRLGDERRYEEVWSWFTYVEEPLEVA